MRYNRLVQLAQLSKTTDSRMFLNDDFNCWINVVFWLDFVPIDCIGKFIRNWIVQTIQIGTIWKTTIAAAQELPVWGGGLSPQIYFSFSSCLLNLSFDVLRVVMLNKFLYDDYDFQEFGIAPHKYKFFLKHLNLFLAVVCMINSFLLR